MTNKVMKYGIMIIAAVLLLTLAFAGVASADTRIIDNLDDYRANFSSTLTITDDTTFYIKDGLWQWDIPSFHNGENQLVINYNVTLDFTNFTNGKFTGIQTTGRSVGGLFGNVSIAYDKTLEIIGLNMTSVNFEASKAGEGVSIANEGEGGILGRVVNVDGKNGNGILNFTNCHMKSCLINSSYPCTGGFLGREEYLTMNMFNCDVDDSVILLCSECDNFGGMIGKASNGIVNACCCNITNSAITSKKDCVGSLIGSGSGTTVYASNCNVLNCSIEGRDGVSGLIGEVHIVSLKDCKVINCSVVGHIHGNVNIQSVGGLLGFVASKVESIENCDVRNCVIIAPVIRSSSNSVGHTGGLVGWAKGLVNNTISSTVENCTIVGVYSNVGGLVGFANSVENWYDNKVINCAVNGTSLNTNYVCGNFGYLENGYNCTVSGVNYIRNLSATEPQPLIVGKVGVESVPQAKAIVTRLSGIGTLSNPQNALGYVIDDAQVEFNSNVGSTEVYPGIIEVGAHTVNTLYVAGYTFNGWNLSSVDGTMLTDATGTLQNSVSGYTNATGYWNNATETLVELYANWTVNTTTVRASENYAEFGNENITAIRSASGNVVKVLLDIVENVKNEDVVFTADNTTLSIPDLNGYTKEEIAVFEIRANVSDFSGVSGIGINVTFKDAATATANKDKIKFFHYNTTNNAWDMTPLTIDPIDPYDWGNGVVAYSVLTTSFSPFGIGIYTEIPQQYTPSSSSKQTGYTVILQEGQTAPTAYATVAPTVAPTVKPTEQPATPTVIATEKPTTQATQQSPAPFVGILAGLGVAALVLTRMRK